MQVSARMQTLVASWHSAKVVRTRDKVTFFLGVMSLLVSAFLFGLAPQCVPFHIFRLLRLRSCVQMDPCCIYRTRPNSPSSSRLYIQETLMALFSFRPLLLRHCPQLDLHVVFPIEPCALHGVLLSIPWLTCERCHHMEKQPRFP